MLRTLIVAVLVVLPAGSFAGEQDIESGLKKTVTVDLALPFEKAIEEVAEAIGINLHLEREALKEEDLEQTVYLRLRNVKASTAIHLLAASRGLAWGIRDGFVLISSHDVFAPPNEIRIHDGWGVGRETGQWDPPGLRIPPGGNGFDVRTESQRRNDEKRGLILDLLGDEASPEVIRLVNRIEGAGRSRKSEKLVTGLIEILMASVAEERRKAVKEAADALVGWRGCGVGEDILVDLIHGNVDPGNWEGEQTIEYLSERQVIVNAPPGVQDEVAGFLSALRQTAPGLVRVKLDILDARNADRELLSAARAGRIPTSLAQKLRRERRTGKGWDLRFPAGMREVALWTTEREAARLEVQAAPVPGGEALRLWFRVRLGSSDAPGIAERPPGSSLSETGMTTLTSSLLLPNGGSTVLFVPGEKALLLTATSEGPAPAVVTHVPRRIRTFDVDHLNRWEAAGPRDLEFRDTPLPDLLAELGALAGVNFVLSDRLSDPEELRLTFLGKGVRPARALKELLSPHHLTLKPAREAIEVASADTPAQPLALSLINLRDLAVPRELDEEEVPWTSEDYASLVMNTIEREHWEEADGKSIQVLGTTIVIRNEPWIIEKATRFLRSLHEGEGPNLHLEVETLTLDEKVVRAVLGEGGAADPITEEKAEHLAHAPGAESDRVTLAGYLKTEMRGKWDKRRVRLLPKSERRPGKPVQETTAASHVTVTATQEENRHRIRLVYQDASFAAKSAFDPDRSPAVRIAGARTTFLLGPGEVGIRELYRVSGKVRVLLLRMIPLP